MGNWAMVIQSIVIMFGLFIAFCIGIHTGQENTDEEWIDSYKRKTPLIKKGVVYQVKCIGGE